MDLADVFVDLDRVVWRGVEHAYGAAEDVPGLLRAFVGEDPDAAARAEEDLWSSLVHQGSVYEASVRAVPFLARTAVAGPRRAELLGLLGAIAESTDERGIARAGAARAAVVAQLPLMMPLLSDDVREVRRSAAWAVAQCGPAAAPAASTVLRRRWATEADPVVRAAVLSACVAVERGAAEDLVTAALSAAQPPSVRVAGLLAVVDLGLPWDAAAMAIVAALAPLRRHVTESAGERSPLKALAEGLRERGDVDEAIELVVAALERAVDASPADEGSETAVSEATWAAQSLALRSRSAPARLLPAMLPLLNTPATAGDVIDAVREWGEPVPEAVPALVRLAEGSSEVADRALAALVGAGAPQASGLLARDLAERPLALEAAWRRTEATWLHAVAEGSSREPLPCTPALLDAVRVRLAAVTADLARGGRRGSLMSDGGLAAANEPVHLVGLLAGWGRAARAAIPALLDALAYRTAVAARALAAVADAGLDPHVITALRSRAGEGPLHDRVEAAKALHALTGDADVLVALLGPALGERNEPRDRWVKAAVALGEQARPLLPHLRALSAEPGGTRTSAAEVQEALKAAGAVRELTGDQDIVLSMVLEGLTWANRPWGQQCANSAAVAAVALGPHARAAVPHLLVMLDRPDTAAAAARALVAAHPDSDRPAGVPLTELVDRVLPPGGIDGHLRSGLAVLESLAALGPTAFTPDRLDRVRVLAEGDCRVVRWGSHDEVIHDDIELRFRARRLLADVEP